MGTKDSKQIINPPSFDATWENLYSQGKHFNRYPYTSVVSFVYRQLSQKKLSHDFHVLEVGCGAGNNLWFAAREGMKVTGIDASKSAIKYAIERFKEEKLEGDFHVGNFTKLPFADCSFDIAIDRAAITSTGLSNAYKATHEINRTLRPGSRFHSELFSSQTTDSGFRGSDNLIFDIKGSYSGVGQICLYTESQILQLFSTGWHILDLRHLETSRSVNGVKEVIGQWNILAEKV